jgi:hypothetical protein
VGLGTSGETAFMDGMEGPGFGVLLGDARKAGEGVKADDFAGMIGGLEDARQLRPGQQSRPMQDPAFDDRTVNGQNALEQFVLGEELGDGLP